MDQKTKEQSFISDNALTWPEDAPAVSMDADLGKTGYNSRDHRIEFDTAKFYEILSRQRLKPDQKRRLHVMLHDTEHTELNRSILGILRGSVLGEYDLEKEKINVRYSEAHGGEPQIEDVDMTQTNNTLLHETKHAIQHQKNRLPDSKLETALMWYGLRYIVPLGVFATSVMINRQTGAPVPPFESAVATHIVGRLLTGYRFRISEISARRFAKHYAKKYGDIITASPLPQAETKLANAA